MANNSNNDDFPTIRLDDEDRRDYQKSVSLRQPRHLRIPHRLPAPPPKPLKKAVAAVMAYGYS